MSRLLAKNTGFILPMVVFLIVVLGGAVVAISQLTTDNTSANNQLLQQARARFMAKAGIDLAVRRLLNDPTGADCAEDPVAFPDGTYTDLSLKIECSDRTYSSEGIVLWDIKATAETVSSTPSDEEYVWQRQRATVELADE